MDRTSRSAWVFLACQEAAVAADVTRDLPHPGTFGLGIDTEGLHFAGSSMEGEEHHVPDENSRARQYARQVTIVSHGFRFIARKGYRAEVRQASAFVRLWRQSRQ